MPANETPTAAPTVAAIYRLEDLEVKEVSVVDRGANMRKLLVVKNADGTPATDQVVAAQANKAEETTDLIVALPLELRDELGTMLSDVSTRLGALSEAVKATDPGAGGLSEKFKSEMAGLGSVLKRLGGVEKSLAINPLDKAALANGTAIDVTGIPHSVKEASIDYVMTPQGPLMRMAPEEMMKVAMRYAIDEMWKADDALCYDEDMAGACGFLFSAMKALAPFIPAGPPASELALAAEQMKAVLTKQYAFNQPQASIAAGVPTAMTGVVDPKGGNGVGNAADLTKKGHKQFTPDRLAQLDGMFKTLQSLMAEVSMPAEPAAVVEPAPAAPPAPVATTKDEGISPEVQAVLAKMAGAIKHLKAENASLSSARSLGNAAAPEANASTPTPAAVSWPDDLNDLPDLD